MTMRVVRDANSRLLSLVGGSADLTQNTVSPLLFEAVKKWQQRLEMATAPSALLFYMGESFPPQVRGMGANVAHVMAPLGGVVGSGLFTILLTAGVDTGLAAIITGTGGLILSALCMAGTRTIHDAHQKSTVFA